MDFWTLFSAFVGGALGALATELIGAVVRASQGAEKQRDDDLADLLENLNSLRIVAEEYWTKSAGELGSDEPKKWALINAHLHHINLIVTDMFTGEPKRECDVAYTPLMRAVAGDTFGNGDRIAQPERLVLVHQAALNFRRKAIKCRRGMRRSPLA